MSGAQVENMILDVLKIDVFIGHVFVWSVGCGFDLFNVFEQCFGFLLL